MINLIKRVCYTIINFYKYSLFRVQFKPDASTVHYYFVDIDNTIADTWPSLKHDFYTSEVDRHKGLAVFIGMRDYLLQINRNPQNVVFYISARNFNLFEVTYNWLVSSGIKLSKQNLLLVPFAYNKLQYIKYVHKQHPVLITFIDDLSYNHEKGKVLFYDEVIEKVKSLPISYIGSFEIRSIHEKRH